MEIVLLGAGAVVLVWYMMRRRTRVDREDSDRRARAAVGRARRRRHLGRSRHERLPREGGRARRLRPFARAQLAAPGGLLVPTYQYFYELAFRIGTAEIVAYAGEAERGGETYDRVFATWGHAEGHRGVDQYVLWINKRTGHVDRVEYTIREMASSALGASEYSEFREVDGVSVPGRIEIKAVFPIGGEMTLHEMSFGPPRFDTVEVGELRPDPTRAPAVK